MAKDWTGMKFPKGGKASMTGAEWLAQSKSKRNKFGAVATDSFPSKLEKAVFDILSMMQLAGEIRDLKRYPSVALTKRIRWKVDGNYVECKTGQLIFWEAKGMMTAECGLKLRLWREIGPGPLHWWTGHHSDPRLTEIILPERPGQALEPSRGSEPPPGQGTGPTEGPIE